MKNYFTTIILAFIPAIYSLTGDVLKRGFAPCCGNPDLETCTVDPATISEPQFTIGYILLNTTAMNMNSVKNTLKDIVALSRAEPQNTFFHWAVDIEVDNKIYFIEKWPNQTALDLHFTYPHFAIWNPPYNIPVIGFGTLESGHCIPKLQ